MSRKLPPNVMNFGKLIGACVLAVGIVINIINFKENYWFLILGCILYGSSWICENIWKPYTTSSWSGFPKGFFRSNS